jgi:hypothetical protein
MSDTYAARAAAHVRAQASVYGLARMADTGDPDTSDSQGATFLADVREAVAEGIEYAEPTGPEDVQRWADAAAHEIADSAVPIYNADRWATAGDLCAWQEDVRDYGEPEDLMQAVGWALYMIAERLVVALVQDVIDELADDDDDDEGEA